jgi:hypothetical protein
LSKVHFGIHLNPRMPQVLLELCNPPESVFPLFGQDSLATYDLIEATLWGFQDWT